MRRARSRLILVLLALLLLLPTTGCWNSREPKNLAIVMALGIDKGTAEEPYRVSFQVANSGVVASNTNNNSAAVPITMFASNGVSIFEAIRKTAEKVPRQLFFAHIRLIMIGETMARSGISELFDFFERSRETRMTSLVLISRGSTAESVLQTLTPLEKLPANAFVGKIKFSSKLWGENLTTAANDVVRMLVSNNRTLLISGVKRYGPALEAEQKANVEKTNSYSLIAMNKIGVFRDGKLVEWLDGPRARGTLWALNKIHSTVMNVPATTSGSEEKAVTIEVMGARSKVIPLLADGKPSFRVEITAEGSVSELRAPVDLSQPKAIVRLEQSWSQAIREEVLQAVTHAQESGLDYIQLNESFKRKFPKAWRRVQSNWTQLFADSPVQVTVHTYIRHQGMRNQSYLQKMNQNAKQQQNEQ
ncbi:germination protein, Ger(x)C family [Paenibacillus curdlanolyticus YK9]|uniref:Germination protein, Ger(X)C family n=1 Tax=Paenibacillus curdlanolyticus YK9 TaxID=717606 RepID=E0IDP3_9BACL|nr:Ger(x)C family spore germination protein [Paenibacillus curdlanolyticus]EFM09247.1 germination protein, Ger(x)C family [Paenibacillus curdlanolyticus YK9]